MQALTMPERITALYLRARHTRQSLATALRTDPAVIQRWEHFEEVPTLVELDDLAEALHVSKLFLCFGKASFRVGEEGEPDLTQTGIEAALEVAGATISEQEAFYRYQRRVDPNTSHSRTFVLTFVEAFRSAATQGTDDYTAMSRAMVIATQAHWLARAVALGVRPVRQEHRTRPPQHLSTQAQAEYMAAEILRLAGLRRPASMFLLAVALGNRLVPTFDYDQQPPRTLDS